MSIALQNKYLNLPWYLILIFLLLSLCTTGASYLYYLNQKQLIKKNIQQELSAIAALKVNEISRWRKERIFDAKTIQDNPFITSNIEEFIKDPSSTRLRAEIHTWLSSLLRQYDYSNTLLLDAKGNVLLSEPEGIASAIESHVRKDYEKALHTRNIVLTDLHREEHSPEIHMGLFIPLCSPLEHASAHIGVLFLKINPYKFLYPLIQRWPTLSPSAETLIVRMEGNDVLFLNELRHQKNTALSLKVPINSQQLPAALAARGQKGVAEGKDYRGIPVLAAIKAVPDSPWILIAKVDTDEVYAPIYEQALFAALLAGLLILLAGAGVAFVWRQQQLAAYRKQYGTEIERQTLSLRYDYLSKYANDIILLFDQNGRIIEANDRASSHYGYSRDELLQLNVAALRSPETRSTFTADMKNGWEHSGLLFETVHQRKNGSTFPVEVSARIIEVEGEKLYQGIIRDISERKQAERELIDTRDFLENIFNTTSDGIMVSDPKGYIERINRTMENMFGFTQEEIMGKHTVELSPQDEWHMEIGRQMITALREKGFVKNFETELLKKDGSLCPIDLNITTLKDRDGNRLGAVSTIHDITERKRAEEALRESEERLRSVMQNANDAIVFVDSSGNIKFWNRKAEEIYSYTADEVLGKPFSIIVPKQSQEAHRKWIEKFLLSEESAISGTTVEGIGESKDGRDFFVETSTAKLKQGNEILLVAVIRDINERKQAEQEKAKLQAQLLQSQKMEAVGHLAGGIAHDFNNILTAVIGYGSLMQMKMREDDPLRANVEQILSASERAANLVRSLLAYSRKQIINPQPVEINDIVEKVKNLLLRVIGEDIELQAIITGEDTTVRVDSSQIEQVLINLAANARDAMPAGGHLTIEIQLVEMDNNYIKAHGYGKHGRYVLLSVADTGMGMDEKTRAQVFEPFFTTKEVGKGTGLGLSTVYGIVKQHDGYINCYSEPDKGTTFKIYLPLIKTHNETATPYSTPGANACA
ncbi:MAG: PAS domain S-box protein [Proteobacteria bacterium]|nr:PAS domain S-box protein [Pseudomonadota bacterium]